MTPTEYALMTAIWSYWWTNQSDPWPSVEHLREQLGKSERQVRRLLQRLRDKGFMLSVEQYNYEHKQVSNRYDFTPFLKRLMDYLEALEQPAKPAKAPGEGVRNGRESVSESARSGCQKWRGIEDESDSDPSNRDTSSSSGSAASSKGTVLPPTPTCSHIAHTAIRNQEKGTGETDKIESRRTSNQPPASQELAAARAKEVKQENTGEKMSKWEEFVLAGGVPRDRLYELETWLQSCPRPEQTPLLVQALIDPISQLFGNGRLIISNRTQATKLYLYARKQGLQHEELEDAFREWVHTAFVHVHPQVEKKMAWFFRALKVELLKGLMFTAWLPAPLPGEAPLEEEATPVTEPSEESASLYRPVEATITQEVTPTSEAGESEESLPGSDAAANMPSPWDGTIKGAEQPVQPVQSKIVSNDPALGWKSYESASWWAERLRDHLDRTQYRYEVLPTEYGHWGFVFTERGNTSDEWIFLTNLEVMPYLKQT